MINSIFFGLLMFTPQNPATNASKIPATMYKNIIPIINIVVIPIYFKVSLFVVNVEV